MEPTEPGTNLDVPTTAKEPPRPVRVLIVEDEQIVAIDLEGHLERLGYHVVASAASGQEAYDQAGRAQPDLILMDVRLDGPLDGIEAARRIRQQWDVPVVFLTAYSDAATLERAKLAEPYGYLVKPFVPSDLNAAIQMALYKGRVDRALREHHENLHAILDAQRQGTVMLDAELRIRFASAAACRMADVKEGTAEGRPLADFLPLSPEQTAALSDISGRPSGQRSKLPLVLEGDGPRPQSVEIEILDDPRHEGGRILFLYDVTPLVDLRRQLEAGAALGDIVGRSPAMRQVFQLIQDVARVDSTVLIEGETGTGKELVARAIHRLGHRRDKRFVAINCAGLSEELAASLLFGHRRGAFTGAVGDQEGLFEAAHGGTLFLDEIGDLPIRVQTTLLRVLEEHAVVRLGESQPRAADVRILAATHRDLAREAAEQRFRQDLLYRIRVARIKLPALRQRREDLPLLVRAFLADHAATTGKRVDGISDEALAILLEYDWPGNVRELRNGLEYAVIRMRSSILQVDDLPPELLEFSPQADPQPADQEDANTADADRLQSALRRARGNRTRAAALLGISRATLYRRLRELGLDEA
ncbi:MAG: sigma 54-interacting transcriptional regulator [Candidatus Anammoximicrobium sp.]|nr:sigma 54-interacting transcriptional regulator [Candidatus Anammoximicrobium sp.]